ncbi:MAG TPA: GNAT family N-acetyltransferase, partial [Bacteroidales bacterium]|nr:GNAT family N-acetyltransferase [Bacteroidales bacterium]
SEVSFAVEQQAGLLKGDKACQWSTVYRSVVGKGRVTFITDQEKKKEALALIMKQHGAAQLTDFEDKQVCSVAVWKISIQTVTGKQSGNWERLIEKNKYTLHSERLIFKEITAEDVEDIHQLHSISEVDEYNTLGIPHSIENSKQYVEEILHAQTKYPRPSVTWSIHRKDHGDFIGITGMVLSNDKFKLGEIYYKLLPLAWGHGYATETAKTLIHFGFETFGLHKVEAGVATENVRSIKVLEKAGMIREGLRRKILPIRGEWKDNYHYAICKEDQIIQDKN